MKQKQAALLIAIAVIVAFIGIVYISLQEAEESTPAEIEAKKNPLGITGIRETVDREELGFEFEYYGGPDGYSLIESLPGQFGDPELLQTLVIVRTNRYIELQNDVIDETPPAITMMMLEKPDEPEVPEGEEEPEDTRTTVERLSDWAATKNNITGFDRKLIDPIETEVDGISAIYYRTDGLYASDVYIIDRKGKYFVFTGQFIEEGSDIDQAFDALMDSIRFD